MATKKYKKHVKHFIDDVTFRTWRDKDLKGVWGASYKIDGVRVNRDRHCWRSKSWKKCFPGLDEHLLKANYKEMYEYYLGDWHQSMQVLRKEFKGDWNDMYMLYPVTDPRLYICSLTDPTADEIAKLRDQAVEKGYEGIVLRQGDIFYKVKPFDTIDLEILTLFEGKGKLKGKLGAVLTERGKVGMGWTVHERELWWAQREELKGKIIEVAYSEINTNGMLRFGRYVRLREDKS